MTQSAPQSTLGRCIRSAGVLLLVFVWRLACGADTILEVAGSTTLAPAIRTAAATLQHGRRLQYRVRAGGSEEGLRELAAGRINVAMVSRPLHSHELRDFRSVEIGRDHIAVLVNARNPIDNVTSDTLRSIFARRLANWPDIGGAPGAIVPVVRGPDHATRSVFDDMLGIGNLIPSGVIELNSNAAMVMYVAADPQAIGYASAGAVADARQRGLTVRQRTIDGMPADGTSVRYPLSRPLLLVMRRDAPARREADLLIEYLTGNAGRALLASYGFALPRR